MKLKLLALLLAVGFSSVAGQPDPSMMCFATSINGEYTAVVSVRNMENPPYDSFDLCDINHNPGLTDNDVVAINIIGSTLIIPTAICRSFPRAQRVLAFNIRLSENYNLYDCRNLESLDLSENNVWELNANTFSNNHLKFLNLSRNSLNETHVRALANLYDLEVLDLSFNRNIDIKQDFFHYSIHLQELYLSNSGLTSLHNPWFYNFTELVRLDISHNPLTDVPINAFSPLRSIRTLQMNSCNFTMLHSGTFSYNTELEYLDMSRNNFITLESSLFMNQTSLLTLILSHNKFEPLPSNIFDSLTSLRVLEMNNCDIDKLEEGWFKSMSELRTLSMSENSIAEIPYKTFGVENNLEELYLQNNQLKVLGATSFGSLRNLRELRVDNNQIYAVDSHFIQQPDLLDRTWFLNNDCIDVNIDEFYMNRKENLELFWDCFHDFDNIPISMDTTPDETYRWYSMRWETLVLHVKAESNVSIIFSDVQSEDHGSTLKIQIGMDRDFYSYIYENGTRVWNETTEGILDKDEWKSFAITWKSNVLQFFQKDWQLALATHTILHPFPIYFFGVRSDVPASFHIVRMEANFKHADFPEVIPSLPTTTAFPATT